MPSTRYTHRRPYVANYTLRRRRFQNAVNANVSTRDVLDPARRRNRRTEAASSFDANNNELKSLKRSYVGALIYKTGDGVGDFAVHVFDGYRVKIRRTQLESTTINRIGDDFPKATTESSSVCKVYIVQKYVPVHYSSCALFELASVNGVYKQRYQVNLHFQRKFVTMLECTRESRRYRSEVFVNVL